MSGDLAAVAEPPAPRQGASFTYDAFLSYSHHDGAVASGIQKGLHRIGRRMGQLNALRVFRDATDLSANPDLWGKVTDAMDRSRYLIVVLSPRAAKSEWVNKEVSHWLEQRGPGQVLMVVAEGHLDWDVAAGRFDPDRSDVALPVLTEPGVLPTEPRFVDISGDAPWDPQTPTFRDKVTDLAAPIHGKTKYELASDDVREQRRFRRLRRAAIAGLALLTVIAVVAAGIAVQNKREADRQRNEAEHQRDEAMARGLAAEAQSMLDGARSDGDVRALQQVLAAYALAPKTTEGALLDAVSARRAMRKIIQSTPDMSQTGIPTGAAFSRDGQRIVIVYPRLVRVLDAATGQQVGLQITIDAPKGVAAVALSQDNQRVVVDLPDYTVQVWDTASGRQIDTWRAPDQSRVAAVAFSPDGQRVVTAGRDYVQVRDVATGQQISQFTLGQEAPQPVAEALALSPDGQRFAYADTRSRLSGGAQTGVIEVRVWDVATGRQIGQWIAADRPLVAVDAVAFSSDGQRVVTAWRDDIITNMQHVGVWDVTTAKPIAQGLTGHTGPVWKVALSPDGQRVVTSGDEGTLQVWDVATAQQVGEPMVGHPGSGLPAFTSDGRIVAFYGGDGTVRWLDNAIGQLPTGIVSLLATSLDGLRIVSSRDYHTMRVWDVASRQPVGEPMVSAPKVESVALSPDGQRVVAGGDDGTVQVWDVASGHEFRPVDADKSRVQIVAFSPDGQRLVSVAGDTLRVWDVATGQQIATRNLAVLADAGVWAVAFSPKGQLVVITRVEGNSNKENKVLVDSKVLIWDVGTGQTVAVPIPVGEAAAFLSPDGKRVITLRADGTALVRDVATGRQVGQPIGGSLIGWMRWLGPVAFDRDGQYMVSLAFAINSVQVWDVATGNQVGKPLTGGPYGALTVALSSDSRHIVAGSFNGVWVWPGPAAWRDELCAKLTTNMSRKEWRDWVSPDINYHEVCPGLPGPQD